MAENSKLDELELRSEYVQEVLGVVPHWIVRWGSTVVLLAIALLLALGWVIHYPDVIPARIVRIARIAGLFLMESHRCGRRGSGWRGFQCGKDPGHVFGIDHALARREDSNSQRFDDKEMYDGISLSEGFASI